MTVLGVVPNREMAGAHDRLGVAWEGRACHF